MVGWLLPSGASSEQLQTSFSDATSESMRKRMGSLSAPKICAISPASTSESALSASGLQQLTICSSSEMVFGGDTK